MNSFLEEFRLIVIACIVTVALLGIAPILNNSMAENIENEIVQFNNNLEENKAVENQIIKESNEVNEDNDSLKIMVLPILLFAIIGMIAINDENIRDKQLYNFLKETKDESNNNILNNKKENTSEKFETYLDKEISMLIKKYGNI